MPNLKPKHWLTFIVFFFIILLSATALIIFQKENSNEAQVQQASTQKQETQLVIASNTQGTNTYKMQFTTDIVLFDAMQELSSNDRDFNFEYQKFSDQPFIVAFNGEKADEEHFWKLYINSQEAGIGVGQYELQGGDNIKFELTEITF